MRVFDASSIIYAWDNYPVNQFPKLWKWIAEQIDLKDFCIARAAFEEVKQKTPDCATWLSNAGIAKISESNDILAEALRIKGLLGIQNDQYGSGVGENDIIVIATAKVEGFELVSDEKRQPLTPRKI